MKLSVPWSKSARPVPRARNERPQAAAPDLNAVNQRIDDLTRQISQIARAGEVNPAPSADWPDHPGAPMSDRLTDAIGRLDGRLDKLITQGRGPAEERRSEPRNHPVSTAALGTTRPSFAGVSVDQAVAEITARRRALDADTGRQGQGAPKQDAQEYEAPKRGAEDHPVQGIAAREQERPTQAPARDLSGLERQLQHITDQLQSLRRPSGIEEAVAELRQELAEIGRSINEAMPRRAVEALESEMRALAQRIDQGRNSGLDSSALSGIEHGLAEVRDALRALTPAESLVGFDEAVKGLTRKIDVVAATNRDPAALRQLEEAITTLRGIVATVASNDALAKLSDEVKELSVKIERVGGADMLSSIEGRIATLADTIRTESGRAVPPHLEAMIQALTDKLDRMQLTQSDHVAMGNLEDRIVRLAEKLDASDMRLGNLGAIERGLADLLVHLEEQRKSGVRGPREVAGGSHPADTIKQEINELKASDRRTHETLDVMSDKLGHVADRLTNIETDLRSGLQDGRAAPTEGRAAAKPFVLASPQAATVVPAPVAAAATSHPEAPLPPARKPLDPNLPPDTPIEPNARSGGSLSDRIISSQTILGPPRGVPETSSSDFVAAARRAAQAANAEQSKESAAKNSVDDEVADFGLRTKITSHVRSLFVGASVILIVLGAVHVTKSMLAKPNRPAAVAPVKDRAASATPAIEPPETAPASVAPMLPPATAPDAPAQSVAPIPATPNAVAPNPAAPDRQSYLLPKTIPAGIVPKGTGAVLPFGPSSIATASASTIETTGSIGTPAASQHLSPPPAAELPHDAQPGAQEPDKLPVGIGGATLRMAAASGDPAAAYEVGIRYADGHGVPQNLMEASEWLKRAANAGLAPAQFRLGSLYEKGQGVKRDPATALRLYTAAAEKGNAKAMHNLAVLYAEGPDGKPDYRSAAKWFIKAAGHGIPDSQYNLAILYARGVGVDQNMTESYKWFTLAAAQGDKDAGAKRDDVAKRLDPQSLMAAKLAAQTFTAEPQPEDAITVKAPSGGWDRTAAAAPPASPKVRTSVSRRAHRS